MRNNWEIAPQTNHASSPNPGSHEAVLPLQESFATVRMRRPPGFIIILMVSKLLSRILLFMLLVWGTPRSDGWGASTRRPGTDTGDVRETARDKQIEQREVVFLLHGIGKGKMDMAVLHRSLRRQGYEVINWRYPSTRLKLEEIADLLHNDVQKYGNRRISFVTHSMGGIVVRTYLKNYRPSQMGRLVMIAPPNQGAYLADVLGNLAPYKIILGPAGQQLRQGENGGCAGAGTPDCDFGIIAGGSGKKFGMNPLVPGDNDGTISVECTKLEGANDFVVLPYAHPVIQMMPRTVRHVVSFLKTGAFEESHGQQLATAVP